MARLVRFRLVQRLMIWGIYLTVPSQRIGVAVVALDGKGRVFMLRHVFHPAWPWGLPGGWLKRNEAPTEGALRELKEETGLTAEIGPPLLISHGTSPAHTGIAFKVDLLPGDLTLSPEIMEASWFPVEELPAPLNPFVKEAISAAQSSTFEAKVHQ